MVVLFQATATEIGLHLQTGWRTHMEASAWEDHAFYAEKRVSINLDTVVKLDTIV